MIDNKKNNFTETQKRIREFINYLGIDVKKFEQVCDLGNGFVSKIGDSITRKSFTKILFAYPDLNQNWVKTGEGQMLLSDKTSNPEPNMDESETDKQMIQHLIEGYIPVYDVTFTLGFTPTFIDSRNNPEVLGYVNFPELRGSTYVVRGKGNSMAPLINDGDFVGIRPVKNKDIIDFGNPYGIITNDLAIFKRIKKSENIYYMKLVSDNMEYEDWEILKADIIHLFVVVGVLSVKSITY